MVVDLRNRPALSALLNNMKRMIPVAVERIDDRGEWILLSSPSFSNEMLFTRLKNFWLLSMTPPDQASFALIFCRFGLNPGVWLHHLATPQLREDYLPGCHDITSWT
jgi:hypothetical protein